DGLALKWSAKQISERLREEHPDDRDLNVSHETIYECLYLQARGELRTQLKLALRQGRTRPVRVPLVASRGRAAGLSASTSRCSSAIIRAWSAACGVLCFGLVSLVQTNIKKLVDNNAK